MIGRFPQGCQVIFRPSEQQSVEETLLNPVYHSKVWTNQASCRDYVYGELEAKLDGPRVF
ncbi:hypothetical protein K491DRAFT_699003 [Lophiostoma macrostomum CBS 122681]|uniref:Uncharacterized protein n=1 Tax=Lophiostoma macrostomum CBS 122681 TaxID=1314788 RepID=A0A6A6SKR3_9PLEO|nr:hypothetical protein K491DRAFT_699003 [Lophiostoma macrostomum CBS 122681]